MPSTYFYTRAFYLRYFCFIVLSYIVINLPRIAINKNCFKVNPAIRCASEARAEKTLKIF